MASAAASAGASKFNVRNPAVKRILQEIKELQDAGPDFIADALEEDIFEWHFVIRGPPDTEFEGGIYHGRILLPAEYPFKPPAFMMLTPNGRFQTGVKICLSISSHHPEHWQPSWSVRTALTALIAFMPTPGQGALGSLDFSKDERRQLAAKSLTDVPKFGSAARQRVVADMHTRFLGMQQQQAAAGGSSPTKADAAAAAAGSVAAAVAAGAVTAAAPAGPRPSDDASRAVSGADQGQPPPQQAAPAQQQEQQRDVFSLAESSSSGHNKRQQQQAEAAAAADGVGTPGSQSSPQQQQQQQSPQLAALLHAGVQRQQQAQQLQQQLAPAGDTSLPGDRGLTFLAVVLSVAILAMLLKKAVVAFGGDVRPLL